MYYKRKRCTNKQAVSSEATPKRSTFKPRTCLGVKGDGTYCSAVFESLDAADRLCEECKYHKKYSLRKVSSKMSVSPRSSTGKKLLP